MTKVILNNGGSWDENDYIMLTDEQRALLWWLADREYLTVEFIELSKDNFFKKIEKPIDK